MVLILETRSHLDVGDLPNLLAAELGVMTVRLERAIRSLDGVARVHVNRWGDGAAHLHLWFLARPVGQLQLRGSFLSMWDDILEPIPESLWRESLAMVAAWLGEFGGRVLAEPPRIEWQAPSIFQSTIDNAAAEKAVTEKAAAEKAVTEAAANAGDRTTANRGTAHGTVYGASAGASGTDGPNADNAAGTQSAAGAETAAGAEDATSATTTAETDNDSTNASADTGEAADAADNAEATDTDTDTDDIDKKNSMMLAKQDDAQVNNADDNVKSWTIPLARTGKAGESSDESMAFLKDMDLDMSKMS
jgi:hypothetical protein